MPLPSHAASGTKPEILRFAGRPRRLQRWLVEMGKRFFVTGGAGFIGSNFVNFLLDRQLGSVTVFDNFSVGNRRHFGPRATDKNLRIIEADVRDENALLTAMASHDVVVHFAANSDIARAADEPRVDFVNGTVLTEAVLEAMRRSGVRTLVFTSGSGVYGDVPPVALAEDFSPMIPVSTYGASKLASEALLAAYCHMFDMTGIVVRFANVVGPHMTHGVSHDFIARLSNEPGRLRVFGNGNQTKPYIHVEDVIRAILLALDRTRGGYSYFNVATEDQLTVREIAEIVIARMELDNVRLEFTGGSRGWRADVPVYKLDTSKIRTLGWTSSRNSRQAVEAAVAARLVEIGYRSTSRV